MNETLSEAFAQEMTEQLRTRVNDRRFEHSMGVAQTARALAQSYGLNQEKAYLAGVLHDWDKGYSSDEIKKRACELGLEVSEEVLQHHAYTLHGPTAALALAQEYPAIPADVLQAVARHTVANTHMEPLDMVLYVADAIEPQRDYDKVEKLRNLVGKVSLEELFFKTMKQLNLMLIKREAIIHPDTLAVWNTYAARQQRKDQ